MKHIFQRKSWYRVFAFLFLSIPYIWVNPLFGGDTTEYIRMFARRPPLYPLFLWVLKALSGESIYIYAAIFLQTLFSAWIVERLLELLCDVFRLEKEQRLVKIIIFLLLLLTYFKADEYHPGCNLWISSEGLAYSLFYLFVYFSIKFLREGGTYKRFLQLLFSIVLLILCRTQFMICLGMLGCYTIYLMFTKQIKMKRVFIFLVLTALSLLFVSGVWNSYKSVAYKTGLNTYSVLESRTNIYAYLTYEDALKVEDQSERQLLLDIYDEIVEKGYNYKDDEKWLDRVDSYYSNLLKLRDVVLSHVNHYVQEMGIEDGIEIDIIAGSLLERQVKILYPHLGLWAWDSLKSLPITMIKMIAFYPEKPHMQFLRNFFMGYAVVIYGLYISANIALFVRKKELQIENLFCIFLLIFTLVNAAITEMFMCSLIRYVAYSFGLFHISGLLVFLVLFRRPLCGKE